MSRILLCYYSRNSIKLTKNQPDYRSLNLKTCSLLLHLFLVVSVTQIDIGCAKNGTDSDKDEEKTDPDAPPPPSPYTLSVNLNVSDQGKDMDTHAFAGSLDSDSSDLEFVLAGANHFQAMAYVQAVNVNIAAQLFVPVALLKSAIGTIPSLTGVDTWTYGYMLTYNNRTWTSNLAGTKISDTAAKWQMQVTSNPVDGSGCCTSFLFFDGQSSTTGSGSWQIYDPTRPGDSAKIFSVTYDLRSPNDKVLMFFVNSDKASASRFGNSSLLRYQISQNDISLEIQDSSEPGKRLIAWNKETKAGNHTDPQGNRVCWDTAALNTADRICD